MWIRTQDDELVNLDHIEFLRVEQDEESGTYEVRAYPSQTSDEDLYYSLTTGTDQAGAESILDEVMGSLANRTDVLDLRRR
jgi:hypothetical protein